MMDTANSLIDQAENTDSKAAAVGLGVMAGANMLVGGIVETVNFGLNIVGSEGWLGNGVKDRATTELHQAFDSINVIVENPSGVANSVATNVKETAQGVANGDTKSIAKATAAATSLLGGKPNASVASTATAAANTAKNVAVGTGTVLRQTANSVKNGKVLAGNAINSAKSYGSRFTEGLTLGANTVRSDVTGGVYSSIKALYDAGKYAKVTAGKHHLMPKALGNNLRYGHKSLTDLSSVKHTVLQGALNEHLRSVTKTLSNGSVVDMMPRRGNSGARVRRMFSLEERLGATEDFYKNFLGGAYNPAYQMEINAAKKAGKLK